METCHDGSQCDDSCSLNVVVKASDLRPVSIQYSSGIGQAKVLAVTYERYIRYSSVQMILTSVDKRQGTTCVQTGRICQQTHRTLCLVHVVAEDQGTSHRSAIGGSG